MTVRAWVRAHSREPAGTSASSQNALRPNHRTSRGAATAAAKWAMISVSIIVAAGLLVDVCAWCAPPVPGAERTPIGGGRGAPAPAGRYPFWGEYSRCVTHFSVVVVV